MVLHNKRLVLWPLSLNNTRGGTIFIPEIIPYYQHQTGYHLSIFTEYKAKNQELCNL